MKSRITIRLTHLLASARPRVFAAYLLLCVSCAWSATQIAITDDIVVSNVSRLGINIGGNNYYDSPSMKVTDTKNFEGISYRQCHEGTLFTNGFGTWRTASNTYINSGWAALMVGGTYRILSGNAAGTTGTIIAVSNIYMMTWNTSQSNVVPFFVLDKPVSLPGGQPQRNAGFMVEKFVLDEGYLDGTYGYWLETNCFLVTGDVSPNSWGVGALNMVGATNRAHFRMATVGQNIAEANGPYRVTFRARKTTAAPVLWVNLDAGIQTNAPVALSTSWTDYSYTMTVT
ncbi:hypothetical protein GX586_10835, partial [bacterium]|nr:hypothetical protein [bacterium]